MDAAVEGFGRACGGRIFGGFTMDGRGWMGGGESLVGSAWRRGQRWRLMTCMGLSLMLVAGFVLRQSVDRRPLQGGGWEVVNEARGLVKPVILAEDLSKRVLYFGYGSNLSGSRLKYSTPTARFVGIARLNDYKLAFTVHSTRWSGAAADVLPSNGSYVLGAVWSIELRDLPALDHQESVFEHLYYRDYVDVTMMNDSDQPERKVLLYRVTEPIIGLVPSKVYMRVLLFGAMHIHLPESYIHHLQEIETNKYDNETLFEVYCPSEVTKH